MSEGGLCVLTPVKLTRKQPVHLEIEVPMQGPVAVEAVAWHTRKVKSAHSGGQGWAVGMMLTKAGEGFETLLPGASVMPALADLTEGPLPAAQSAAERLEEAKPATDGLEEDSLSPEELDAVDLHLLSPSELHELSARQRRAVPASEEDTLQMFRVRVKAKGGPRTRTLTLGAVSAEEAEVLAIRELGDEWTLLEVREP